MPRKKGDPNVNNIVHSNGSKSTSGGNDWKWVNCKLSDSDIDVLDSSDSTLEYLATCCLALADDGYGVTIKPVDSGKTICCTLYRPLDDGRGTIVALSSFGGNVRDAILTTLYKLDTYLGGELTIDHIKDTDNKSRQRFR